MSESPTTSATFTASIELVKREKGWSPTVKVTATWENAVDADAQGVREFYGMPIGRDQAGDMVYRAADDAIARLEMRLLDAADNAIIQAERNDATRDARRKLSTIHPSTAAQVEAQIAAMFAAPLPPDDGAIGPDTDYRPGMDGPQEATWPEEELAARVENVVGFPQHDLPIDISPEDHHR